MNRMRRYLSILRSLPGCLSLVAGLLGGCVNSDLIVQFESLSEDVKSLEVQVSLDGMPFKLATLSPPLTRQSFVLSFPEGVQGSVTVSVTGFGSSDCKVAAGRSPPVLYGMGTRGPRHLTLALDTYSQPRCPVSVEVQGDGVVESQPPGIRCGNGNAQCEYDFITSPQSILMLTTPGAGILATEWSSQREASTCSGRSGCSIHADGRHRIKARFVPQICPQAGAWCTVPISTNGKTLRALWGESSSDLWAVGDEGTILHYDGTKWAADPYSGQLAVNLRSVFGSAERPGEPSLFAVGDYGTILQRKGGVWSEDKRSSRVLTHASLLALTGSAKADGPMWAAGTSGTVLRYQGGVWERLPAAAQVPAIVSWRALLSTGRDEVWLGGDNGLVFRLSGSSWGAAPNDSMIPIDDISALLGAGGTRVWLTTRSGKLTQYDGAQWTTAAAPAAPGLNALDGSGPADLWAVGDGGTLLHYDGMAWRRDSQSGLVTTAPLLAVWAKSRTEVWAVGVNGIAIARQD